MAGDFSCSVLVGHDGVIASIARANCMGEIGCESDWLPSSQSDNSTGSLRLTW